MKEANKISKGMFFKTFIPLVVDKETGSFIIEKAIKGIKQKYLVGQASNTLIDKANEQVSKKFLQKMKDTAKGLNVFSEHDRTIEKTLGYVSDTGGDDDSFVAETHLEPEEDNPLVTSILKKLAHGTKLGYSIGGCVTETSVNKDLDKPATILEDGEIYELSLTAIPEGNETFVGAIFKSLSKDKIKIDDDEQEKEPTPVIEKNIIKEPKPIETNEQFIKNFMIAWSAASASAEKSLVGHLEDQRNQIGLTKIQLGNLSEKYVEGEMDEKAIEGMIGHFQKVNEFTKEVINENNEGDKNSDIDRVLLKILEEMSESDSINNDLYDLFWTFRSAMYQITFDDDLDAASKKEKINLLASEYGDMVETLVARLGELAEAIETQLS